MADNRAKILERIKALMNKTVENGCTEAEAMSALSLARSMMDAYEVTEEDIQLKGEEASIYTNVAKDPHLIRRTLVVYISIFADCKTWATNNKGEYKFCGLQSDIEFASYLLDTLSAFTTRELIKYLAWYPTENLSQRRKVINGFVLGCCGRINQRLKELIEESKAKAGSNSKALVVAKGALISAKMSELGLNLHQPRKRRRYAEENAFKAGKAVGDKASFGRPVAGQAGAIRIGFNK